jgi:regulatory protein
MPTPRQLKGPRKVTPDRLQRWALAYLERFSASAESLRRVLMRRVERLARAHGTDREEGRRLVDALILRMAESGLVDDSRFADGRVETLRRRGASARGIRSKLAAKGVDAEIIDGSLAQGPSDLAAAAALIRRRRLGLYRPPAERAPRRERDLAVLARAGFGYDVALKVIEAESEEALARLLAEADA